MCFVKAAHAILINFWVFKYGIGKTHNWFEIGSNHFSGMITFCAKRLWIKFPYAIDNCSVFSDLWSEAFNRYGPSPTEMARDAVFIGPPGFHDIQQWLLGAAKVLTIFLIISFSNRPWYISVVTLPNLEVGLGTFANQKLWRGHKKIGIHSAWQSRTQRSHTSTSIAFTLRALIR